MGEYTTVILWDLESQVYMGYVLELPGAMTHGDSVEEVEENLKEVQDLVLKDFGSRGMEVPKPFSLADKKVVLDFREMSVSVGDL